MDLKLVCRISGDTNACLLGGMIGTLRTTLLKSDDPSSTYRRVFGMDFGTDPL